MNRYEYQKFYLSITNLMSKPSNNMDNEILIWMNNLGSEGWAIFDLQGQLAGDAWFGTATARRKLAE
jgi:hypothetical protein